MPAGRPTDYTPELGERICNAIASSVHGLERICEENPEFPAWKTIYNWKFKHSEFLQKYMQARESQSHNLMDHMLNVAYDNSDDNLTKINRAKVIIDVLKITSARFNPRHFGEKREIKSENTNHQKLEEVEKLKELRKKYEEDA